MKKQDITHFFDEHKTELICLGVGIGIGAYAVYRHYFGPIHKDVTNVILEIGGKNQAKAAKTLSGWWNAASGMTSKGGSCAVQQTPVAKEAIEELLKEVGNDGHIMWWIEKL